MIKTYEDFYNFFGDYPRAEDVVYTESQNGQGKPGYRGKGYQVIIEPEEWDLKYLKSCMSVIFKSLSGDWYQQRNDWIVALIIDEIEYVDADFYQKITNDEWFNENINRDYSCASDFYADYNYDEDKYYKDIQSGKFKNYSEYLHHLAEAFVTELKEHSLEFVG